MLRQGILLILDLIKNLNPGPNSTSSHFCWIYKAPWPSFISFNPSWLASGCPTDLVLLTDDSLITKTHNNCLPLQRRHLFVYHPEKIAHGNSPKPNYHVVPFWDFSSPGHVPCCVRWGTGHYFRTYSKSCSRPEELYAFQVNAAIKNALGCMKTNIELGLRKSMALVSPGSLGKMCLLWNLNDVLPLGIAPAAFLSLT